MPSLTRAASLPEAITQLTTASPTFDLVLSFHPFADREMYDTVRALKHHARTPHVYPIVTDLTASGEGRTGQIGRRLSHTDLTAATLLESAASASGGSSDYVDPTVKVFLWNGDPKLMLSLIKVGSTLPPEGHGSG